MSEFFNGTMINPGPPSYFKSGFVAYGEYYYNGSTFNGPGLARFECPYAHCFITSDSVSIIPVLLFLCLMGVIVVFARWNGLCVGRHRAVENIISCRNEKERMNYCNYVMREYPFTSEVHRSFKRWPGEQESENVVARRLALCRDDRERMDYANGILKAYGWECRVKSFKSSSGVYEDDVVFEG